jgi:hypothetical protein
MRHMKLLPWMPCAAWARKWCGVTVMLRAGPEVFGVTVRTASLAGYRRVLDWKLARRVGIAPTSTRVWSPPHCLSATSVLEMFHVLPFKDAETANHHSLPQSHTPQCRAPRPWMADRPHMRIDLPIKNEHRCHARGGVLVTPSLASHPQVFHGGCFGVYGTPPGEAFWCCKIGTKNPRTPRLSIGI